MNSKLVSCIIPTHNRQLLLRRAIESVISQTYKNLEIIVVDDSSEDNTELVVKEYMEKDNRIIYLKNPKPLGGSGTRNVGIKFSTGEYIAFLDDDDEWLEDKIEKQLKAIKNFDALLCACIINNKKRLKSYDRPIVNLYDLRKGNIFTGGTSILMARLSIIKNNLFDEKLPSGQDWDLLIRMAGKYKIGYLNEPLVIYSDSVHKRITNEMINMQIDQLEKRMRVIYKHENFFGPYWFKYHIGRRLLSYIKFRDKKWKHIIYTIRRCGLFAVLRVFLDKIVRNVSKI